MAAEEEGTREIAEDVVLDLEPTGVEEKRKAHDAERSKSRLYLYEQIVQWRALKTELNFNRDKELAEFLMGSYLSKRNVVKWYVTVLYRVVIIDDFVYYCHSINVTKNFTS